MRRINKLVLVFSIAFIFSSCGESLPPNEPTLVDISLSGNYSTSFWQNKSFDYDGLVVTAHYDNNSSEIVIPTSVSTPDMSTVGEKEVTVTYLNKTKTYTVVVNLYATYIDLSGEYQKEFSVGEQFNHDGLIVTVHYSNQTSEVVTDYEVSYSEEPVTGSTGTKTITISYEKSFLIIYDTYDILVKDNTPTSKVLSSISLSDEVTEFTVGDDFIRPKVTAHFSDNTTSDVSSLATFSGFDMSASGTQTVTVSYTYLNVTKTKTYQITVSEKETPGEEDTYKGHMYFASNLYQLTIQLNDKNKYYLNPGVKDKDNKDIDVGDFPFTFEFDNTIVDVSRAGGISSKKVKTGTTTVTCIYRRYFN